MFLKDRFSNKQSVILYRQSIDHAKQLGNLVIIPDMRDVYCVGKIAMSVNRLRDVNETVLSVDPPQITPLTPTAA